MAKTPPKIPTEFVAEVKVIDDAVVPPSSASNLLDTGQFKVLQNILTQIRQESASKEPPANGKIEVEINKVAEMEKALIKMREEIIMLTRVNKKPAYNTGNIYLIIIAVVIVTGLASFLMLINLRQSIDPVIAGTLTLGFVSAIVTLLNNSMQASKALELQQRSLERQEEADIQRQLLLLQSEETMKETQKTHSLVNSEFTIWKETYLKKEFAEGQRAGLHEAEQRADDVAASKGE